MASKYTKIPRAISEFKQFLEYYYGEYRDAYRFIRPSEGWNIPYYSNEIYSILQNLDGNLFENLYPKLSADNPVSDEEIINSFEGAMSIFEGQTSVFEKIHKARIKHGDELILGSAEGTVQELLYRAIFKLREVIQLAKEDIARSEWEKTIGFNRNRVCIVTATTAEFKALLSKIPNAHPLPTEKNDSQIYQSGKIVGKDGAEIEVIFTQLHFQGIASASNTTTKMVLAFNPALIVMLGHAAGNKNLKRDLAIGDILICKEAIDYDSAVIIEKGTPDKPEIHVKEKPNPFKADSTLLQALRNFAMNEDKMNIVKSLAKHSDLMKKNLGFRDGKLLSGDALVRSEEWFKQITRDSHEAIGLDMETFGVYYAAENTVKENKPLFISLKSVSDFGGKGNDFPEEMKDPHIRIEYAIDISIIFFLEFAKENLPL